jgi:hypothetical protein
MNVVSTMSYPAVNARKAPHASGDQSLPLPAV